MGNPPVSCIFCRLIAGEIPSHRVHEDELTLAFMDLGQLNPGHTLVAVKHHAATLLDITPDEAAAVMRTARRVALAVKATFDPPGMTLLQANGKEGDQTVFHFHLHVVPRYAGKLLRAHGRGFAEPALLAEQAVRLKAALAGLRA